MHDEIEHKECDGDDFYNIVIVYWYLMSLVITEIDMGGWVGGGGGVHVLKKDFPLIQHRATFFHCMAEQNIAMHLPGPQAPPF